MREEERRKERMKRAEEKKWLREREGQRKEEKLDPLSWKLVMIQDSRFGGERPPEGGRRRWRSVYGDGLEQSECHRPNYRHNTKTGSDVTHFQTLTAPAGRSPRSPQRSVPSPGAGTWSSSGYGWGGWGTELETWGRIPPLSQQYVECDCGTHPHPHTANITPHNPSPTHQPPHTVEGSKL